MWNPWGIFTNGLVASVRIAFPTREPNELKGRSGTGLRHGAAPGGNLGEGRDVATPTCDLRRSRGKEILESGNLPAKHGVEPFNEKHSTQQGHRDPFVLPPPGWVFASALLQFGAF
mgnify:CR=1 FL=1